MFFFHKNIYQIQDFLNCQFPFCIHLNLNFSCRKINDELAIQIGQGLSFCTNLQNLALDISGDQHQISSEGIKGLTEGLKNCQNLRSLLINLDYNKLTNECIINLTNPFPTIQNLNTLILSFKSCSLGNSMSSLCLSISKCFNLTTLGLVLNSNGIIKEGFYHLGISIQNCKLLRCFILSFESNGLVSQDLNELSQHFKNCKSLRSLKMDLNFNRIQDQGAQDLCQQLIQNSYLYCLKIMMIDNQIKNQVKFQTIRKLKKMSRLVDFYFKA
ncbi:kinase domain protein, putative (macronuclear) [Tetrahymena thermophila SB210]|uniref:Kinase domain protein, putative n=1 Tax=Tetrahymena thermophila (strain SB210) TaxID=312017 RepID=W7XKU9_TETTS|nr:kinase domain protein, putative [Tetrahymena thermophila SB210]EWS75249.1 kinase domain protein, putative [Tetrahymena thermophila SB210]|eukprot:XP_012652240.1 kinase domain protein, putative [Tetrahymena thermophila SB210]